ncbi:MAG: ADP-ribosylglycohydrolase family protein [Chloroflexia bacterium]
MNIDEQVLSRAEGCLLGQCAGDALGSIVEFKSLDEIRRLFPNGLRVIGPSPVFNTLAGQPTDDSEMALALARTLVRHGWDVELVAGAYADWLESKPFDVGNTVGQSVRAMLQARKSGGSLAGAAERHGNKASEANGALMRQSPLALWGHSLPQEELDTYVRADTRLTHANRICEDASSAYIAALAATIREGLSAQEAYKVACDWNRTHGQSVGVTQALKDAEYSLPDYLTHKGHVLVALQNAFYQAQHAPGMEEGVVQSVMGGGDTDTNAAIAGALLGAIYGREGLPYQWRTVLRDCKPQYGVKGVLQPRPQTYWPNDLEGEEGLAARLLNSAHASQSA